MKEFKNTFVDMRQVVSRVYRMLVGHRHVVDAARSELQRLGFKTSSMDADIFLRQASFGMVLKLLLYEVVARQYSLPRLNDVDGGEVYEVLQKAYKTTALSAFAPSWIDASLSAIDVGALADDIARLASSVFSADGDVLGRFCEEWIASAGRRVLGEFYTPEPVAEFMTAWVLTNGRTPLLDPGVGSGVFLNKALDKLGHGACAQLYGVDISPIAVLMSTINIMRRVPQARPNIFRLDFLKMSPTDIGVESFNAIISNPPYTRHHELLPRYKEEAVRRIAVETGLRISGLSSLYLFFVLRSFAFLRDGGASAFIVPSEWMEGEYGAALRKFLKERVDVASVILFSEDSLVFPDALTLPSIVLIRKEPPRGRTRLIKVQRWPTAEALLSALEGDDGDYKWGRVATRSLASIPTEAKWTTLFEAVEFAVDFATFTTLGAIAKITRGIATGANDYFALSESEVKKFGIEPSCLAPIVPAARHLSGYSFTWGDWEKLRREGRKVYLLWCHKQKSELAGTSVLRYIELGEKMGINRRYLARQRAVWYWVERREPPDAFVTYMFRKELRFVYNDARVLYLNTLHGLYFSQDIKRDPNAVKALLAYLNSPTALKLIRARTYGGGLYKIEPREVEKMPIINPLLIPQEKRRRLATLFEELCQATNTGKSEDIRRLIDLEVQNLLNTRQLAQH